MRHQTDHSGQDILRGSRRDGDQLGPVGAEIRARPDGRGSRKDLSRGNISKMIETLERPVITQFAVVSADVEPRTLPELFLKSVTDYDLPDALNYKKDGAWKPISSRQMIARSVNIALGLHSLGLRKGDRAAILAANSPEWTLADAGCQFAGVVDVPI